jgi:hypothetical protein
MDDAALAARPHRRDDPPCEIVPAEYIGLELGAQHLRPEIFDGAGPSGLTNLTDAERAVLKAKVEAHVDPAIIEERNNTIADMQAIEEAWQRAEALLVKRGNLVKLPSGEWGWIDAGRKQHEVAA